MSNNSNIKTPNPKNPSSLKSRYEIRKLGPEHLQWTAAIVCHSNAYYSPVWPVIYAKDMSSRFYGILESIEYLVSHQIDSGLSFGVFDTEYEYKTEEARMMGGKLYWDRAEPSIQAEHGLAADGERLLKQMDFPLVSVALSYDAVNSLDEEKMAPLVALLPQFGIIYHVLAIRDARDPSSWQATGPGQVLMRNATSTRHDYEGHGNMGGLARWLMREAAQRGFRGIQIEALSDAVTHVWSTAEPPFKACVVSEFHTGTWTDEEGNLAFAPAQQRVTKCYVDLKPELRVD
jgi:hypothetical protein